MVSKQGLLQASGSSTDLAIDGGGFFVTRATSDASSDIAYTRAGAFRPDEEGYLRNPAGLYLYGWRLDATGDYTNTGSVEALEPVRVSDLVGTASPTTRIQARMNLQSTTANYAGAYTAGDMASGTVTPQFSRSFDVSDAQGGTHRVTMGFIKTGPNTWQSEVYSNPASDVTAPGGVLASGTIKFNGDGSLDRTGSTAALFNPLNVTWTNNAGSVPITLAIGSDDGIDGITQSGGESSLISSNVDGGMREGAQPPGTGLGIARELFGGECGNRLLVTLDQGQCDPAGEEIGRDETEIAVARLHHVEHAERLGAAAFTDQAERIGPAAHLAVFGARGGERCPAGFAGLAVPARSAGDHRRLRELGGEGRQYPGRGAGSRA